MNENEMNELKDILFHLHNNIMSKNTIDLVNQSEKSRPTPNTSLTNQKSFNFCAFVDCVVHQFLFLLTLFCFKTMRLLLR